MTEWGDNQFTFTVRGANFTTASNIHVTFKQNSIEQDVTDVQVIDNDHLYCELSQKESGKFNWFSKKAKVQINWLNANGKRREARTAFVDVDENLLEEELK